MSTRAAELEPEKEREPEKEAAPAQEEKATSRKPSALRNPRVRHTFLFAGVIIAIIAILLWLHYRNRESTNDAQVNAHIIPIAPRISGSVIDVLVKDNQAVKKGQVLVRLDPRDFPAKLDDAKAALALAQSRAQAATVNVPLTSETTQSGTTSANAVVAAAQANYEQANLALQTALTSGLAYAQANVQEQEAKYQKAESDLTRMKPLAAKAEIFPAAIRWVCVPPNKKPRVNSTRHVKISPWRSKQFPCAVRRLPQRRLNSKKPALA